MIDSYSFGSIMINGKTFNHDVIIFKGEISSWWRKTSHNVIPEDIAQLIEKKPKVIIFGNGAAGVMKVSNETRRFLENKGIKVEILRTAEAVERFNKLLSEGDVAAALHLTC